MAFRRSRARNTVDADRRWSEDELIWGVPRRAGYDEQDDPKAHAGLTQHAFEPGNDERAICGFEPPRRANSASARPRPQLAVASARLNPRCVKCVRLLAPAAATALPIDALIQLETTQVGEAAEDPAVLNSEKSKPSIEASRPPEPEEWPDEKKHSRAGGVEQAPVDEKALADDDPSGEEPRVVDDIRSETESPVSRLRIPPPPPPPPVGRSLRGGAVQTALALGADARHRQKDAWEGTAELRPGQLSTAVWPGPQPGFRVVASVVAGPTGTRVAAVTAQTDGTSLITLAEPVNSVVTVAWFSVPIADDDA